MTPNLLLYQGATKNNNTPFTTRAEEIIFDAFLHCQDVVSMTRILKFHPHHAKSKFVDNARTANLESEH
jgi:hypothetical protein